MNFLLWLASRWLWDKRLVVPELTGPKSFMCSPRNTGNINVSLWLTGGCPRVVPTFKKFMCSKFMCLFLALVAQCSATPATVAATPPWSATPFQTQISVRHLRGQGGRCDTKIFRGCSATPVLHLQHALKSRKSAATRVVRDRGYPQSCATKFLALRMPENLKGFPGRA